MYVCVVYGFNLFFFVSQNVRYDCKVVGTEYALKCRYEGM